MAVLNDYECQAHGAYEAYGPVCPYGCAERFQKLVFNQAPGVHSVKTKNTDNTLRTLAADFKLTDMKNDPKSGGSVMDNIKRGNFRPQWDAVTPTKERLDIAPTMAGNGMPSTNLPKPVPLLRRDPRGVSDLQ